MISYEDWKIVYDDSELDVRLDPQELQGYGMHIKNSEKYLLFPIGTLKEIALADRDSGKRSIINLLPYILQEGEIFKGNSLNYDSIIAAVTKAYLNEEERFRNQKDIFMDSMES